MLPWFTIQNGGKDKKDALPPGKNKVKHLSNFVETLHVNSERAALQNE